MPHLVVGGHMYCLIGLFQLLILNHVLSLANNYTVPATDDDCMSLFDCD